MYISFIISSNSHPHPQGVAICGKPHLRRLSNSTSLNGLNSSFNYCSLPILLKFCGPENAKLPVYLADPMESAEN